MLTEVLNTRLQLPERKAGPMQEFIRGGEKDFRMLNDTKTPYDLYRGMTGHVQSAFFSLSSFEIHDNNDTCLIGLGYLIYIIWPFVF